MRNTITKAKIDFSFPHGTVEGMYVHAPDKTSPLVIITNGHNGFYNYGMFPYIQESLADSGIASYSYNFSHGGVRNGDDVFEDLEAYQQNCMRLERLDLIEILRALGKSPLPTPARDLYLLSHSLGSIPTLFAAMDTLGAGIPVHGIIFIAPIRTLDVFPEEMMREWKKTGIYYMKNNRTGQMLPQGAEFLREILESETDWNVEHAIKSTRTAYLMVHGAEDKDVPVEHSESLVRWAKDAGITAELRIVPAAGHTFNTKHPFQGTTTQLDEALRIVREWIFARVNR